MRSFFAGFLVGVSMLSVNAASEQDSRLSPLSLPRIISPAGLVSNHLLAARALLPALPPAAETVRRDAGVFLLQEGELSKDQLNALALVKQGDAVLYEV